ncbi:MAG: nitronate monooxygenase [Kordiimonadaceae bacterium]|nr:nitronate monooxygenase [Kordiimonadaceae bacterium]
MEIAGAPIDTACGKEFITMLKDKGVLLFQKVGSLRHALHVQKVGYDGVYAAGIEEGGHPLNDDVSTMILTPKLSRELDIAVVTTGGIADGETMAAALTLGADGVRWRHGSWRRRNAKFMRISSKHWSSRRKLIQLLQVKACICSFVH